MNSALQLLFLIPEVCQLICEKKNKRVFKHLSQIVSREAVEQNLHLLRQSVFELGLKEFPISDLEH